ncbi:MAG: NUDIX domain-containing protein [Pseudomonadota bacterium]
MTTPPVKPTTPQTVETLDHETVYDGYFTIDRYTLQHETFDGGMSAPLTREIFERGPSVGALAYDAKRDQVVLICQFRVGAYAVDYPDPWLVEIVAGSVEPGEQPEAVARREMREETGMEAGRLEHMYSYFVSPGGATEHVELYCAEVDANQAAQLAGHQAEGEDIQTRVMECDDALAMLAENRINNAVSIIALQWLAVNRERLRAAWQ